MKQQQEQYDEYDGDVENNDPASEQEYLMHVVNVQQQMPNRYVNNRKSMLQYDVDDNYLATFVLNLIKFSTIFQIPLIILIPILQMLLIVNNYCIDTYIGNDNEYVSLLKYKHDNIIVTAALFIVPTLWWIFVWIFIYVSQGHKIAYYDQIVRILYLLERISYGLFVVDNLFLLYSFLMWADPNIRCDTQQSIQAACYWLTMIRLIHNIIITFSLCCCVVKYNVKFVHVNHLDN
eukprot:430024_1